MGKILPVTSNQSDAVRQMANEKGVGRANWQRAHDDKRWTRFLDGLKELVPPEGARIHILRAKVKLDRPWQEAVDTAGPNTPSDYNIRTVGDLYVPTETGEEERDYVLLNYPNGDGSWDKSLAWAAQEELQRTAPREAFAVGEQYPTLHYTFGMNPIYVVATTECFFEGCRQACSVWWRGAGREASLRWVSCFGGSFGWVLFRKMPSASGT